MSAEAPSIEIVMSEFGAVRQNAGGAAFGDTDRLEPAMTSLKAIFPNATVTLYTDLAGMTIDGVDVVEVDPPFDRQHPRYGWRAHDYYQAYGLLQTTADIAIATDSDMLVVSDDFRAITRLAQIFGICVPVNPRLLLKIDGGIGADSTYDRASDETRGLGVTYNLTPIAFDTAHVQARQLLEAYCTKLLAMPGRGAVHLAAASYELGFQPHVLAPPWCVCSPRDLDSKHMWKEALALHVGHVDVLPRYKRERRLERVRQFVRKVRGR